MKNAIHRTVGIVIGIYLLPLILLVYPYSRFVEGDDRTFFEVMKEWLDTFILNKPTIMWSL